MSRRPTKPKRLACRWCGDTIDGRDGMHVSHWSHSHPAVCRYRQDRMPALNGVHVGDLWRNLHSNVIVRIEELRLGGDGTYTDREPVAVVVDVWRKPDEETLDAQLAPDLAELAAKKVEPGEFHLFTHVHPLWSLVEHWEPLTRPDVWPVPWEWSKRRGWEGCRSVPDAWRCPGYRGGAADRDERDKQYWHAYHTAANHCIDWDTTNRLWQIDPDAEPTLADEALRFNVMAADGRVLDSFTEDELATAGTEKTWQEAAAWAHVAWDRDKQRAPEPEQPTLF